MKSELSIYIAECISQLFKQKIEVELTRPESKLGDYSTNVALQLSGRLKKQPRLLAEQLAEEVSKHEAIDKVEVAGSGFINILLTDQALFESLNSEPEKHFKNKKVVIETNNPNPFKAMHIGHAFNAILGDTIANLLALGGAEVHRVSYHGDVGAHVGKSMWAIMQFIDGDISKLNNIPENERNTFMSAMYSKGNTAYKENPDTKQEIEKLSQESFKPSDPLYKQVYETCKTWSFEQIDNLVSSLDNQPIEKRYLESDADALGVQTVKAHKGEVFIESNGALVFPGKKYGIFDNVFVASNGQGLYGARDLGLMQLKNNDFHADKSYIVTAEEQKDYFRGVIKAAELCLPELKNVTTNISTGTVKLSTGKMSSRSGDVVEVTWLFDQVGEAVEERGGEIDTGVVAGALRYQFLKVRIGSDVTFDVNEAVSLQGNSGSYLQYAHARARSILSKIASKPTKEFIDIFDEHERPLVQKFSEYSEIVSKASLELKPHHVCTYLYELAQEFNRFYEKAKVIGDERQDVRIGLVWRYADILKEGMKILGIKAPDRM